VEGRRAVAFGERPREDPELRQPAVVRRSRQCFRAPCDRLEGEDLPRRFHQLG
jgi:hypothetical protein